MDEILQKLLSSELLSEEAKAEISSQWTAAVEQYKTIVREEVSVEVRSELAEQWATEREALIESVEKFVASKLEEEVAELIGDIQDYRDLKAEAAAQLVEEKHRMAEELAQELDQLVDKMDAFFELRLSEELEELREDLDVVKQNEFGRRIFEAFVNEYMKFADEDSVQAQLTAALDKLRDAQQNINKLEEAQAKLVRESKLEKILAPLSGKKREQMAFVLANVETTRLEEAYNHFIGRVLKEEQKQDAPADAKASDAAAPVLTEQANVVVTGEEAAVVEAAAQAKQAPASDAKAQLRRLAGLQ
jgi:hypothetical protein